MIKLKSLITESGKNIKILIKGKKGEVDQLVTFAVHESDGVFVLLPKTSKELDKLDLTEHDSSVETMKEYLKKSTNIEFKWDLQYNSRGAGYGFKINYDKIINKIK